MAHSPGIGPNGIPRKVHIQSGYNDAYTIVGKLVAYINQAAVKELGFVNAHYIYL